MTEDGLEFFNLGLELFRQLKLEELLVLARRYKNFFSPYFTNFRYNLECLSLASFYSLV